MVLAAPIMDVEDSDHLVGDAVPAVVKGGGLVLRPQRYHHQVVAGTRHVEQDDQGTNGRRLAHRRALLGAAERGGGVKKSCTHIRTSGAVSFSPNKKNRHAQKCNYYPASTCK